MRFDVVTIFPGMFDALRTSQIWARAEESGRIELNLHDLRAFTEDRHRTVDDSPYGGGPGMVLKLDPLVRAVESIPAAPPRKVLFATPQGKRLSQGWAEDLARLSQLVVVTGRYEGVDERFIEGWVDETFSIGDYVLAGGELPAMVLCETISRLIEGVVGDQASVESDSFSSGVLKHPQYTRPASYRGRDVPSVLLSGDHAAIEKWRKEESIRRTRERRPDLLKEPCDVGA